MNFVINVMSGLVHDVSGSIAEIDVVLKTGEVAIAVGVVAEEIDGLSKAVANILVPKSQAEEERGEKRTGANSA